MSYSKEQAEKNKEYIEIHMAKQSQEDRNAALRECLQLWADDNEVKEVVERKKQEISLRATDAEMEEVMKDYRI